MGGEGCVVMWWNSPEQTVGSIKTISKSFPPRVRGPEKHKTKEDLRLNKLPGFTVKMSNRV